MRFLYLLIFFAGWCKCQDFYKQEHLSFKDGLPSDVVNSTAKKDGFLYVATQRGLSLYDGYRFINSPEIKSLVSNIFVTSEEIYGEEIGSGLFEIKNIYDDKKMVASVDYSDGNPDNDHYQNIYRDHNGNIWCTDFHFIKFYNFKNKLHRTFKISDQNKQLDLVVTYLEIENELLMATSKGLFRYSYASGTLTKINAEDYSTAWKWQNNCFW